MLGEGARNERVSAQARQVLLQGQERVDELVASFSRRVNILLGASRFGAFSATLLVRYGSTSFLEAYPHPFDQGAGSPFKGHPILNQHPSCQGTHSNELRVKHNITRSRGIKNFSDFVQSRGRW